MRFLSLPRGAVRSVAIATVLLLAWIVWGTFKDPEALWAPGDLSRFHADITDCDDCHQPFRGPSAKKCIVCHGKDRFIAQAKPKVSKFHQKILRNGKSCLGCHTEHRGALAQINIGALVNPHGEFVFRATGTRSCNACHDFSAGYGARARLLDNIIVRQLLEEDERAHRPGKMKNCLACHKGGRLQAKG